MLKLIISSHWGFFPGTHLLFLVWLVHIVFIVSSNSVLISLVSRSIQKTISGNCILWDIGRPIQKTSYEQPIRVWPKCPKLHLFQLPISCYRCIEVLMLREKEQTLMNVCAVFRYLFLCQTVLTTLRLMHQGCQLHGQLYLDNTRNQDLGIWNILLRI